MKLVVDSGVAIKWFATEADSEVADQLRRGFELVAPDLLLSECVNAFWKKERRGEMTVEDVVWAGAMAVAFDHPAYDCFHPALAADRAAPFVTADPSLVRKLRAAGFGETEVLTLAEAAALAA